MASPPPETPRRRARRGEGDRLHDELVEAAIGLLGELGDSRLLTLRGVARRAGVAAPSVYLHFPDLEALVATVETRLFAEFGALLADAAAGRATAREALDATARDYLAYAEREPLRYRVLFAQVRPRTSEGLSAGDPVFDALVDLVAASLDAVDPRPPRRVAQDIWAALHGVASLHASFPGFGWPDAAEQGADVVDAILRRPGIADA